MTKKKRFLQSAKAKLGAVVLGAVGASSMAMADGDFGSNFSPDIGPVLTVAGLAISAIGSIWAVKKVIALGNKS